MSVVEYTYAFNQVGTEASNAISGVLPIAVSVLAVVVGIAIAVKVIKRITGR